MKKLLITAAIFVTTLSFSSHGAIDGQKTFKFVGDTQYAGICEAAATDNVPLFKHSVRRELSWMNISKRKVLSKLQDAENFQCAGKGVVDFAKERGAKLLLNYLAAGSESTSRADNTAKFSYVGDLQYADFCKATLSNNVALFKRSVRSQVGLLAASKQEVLDIVLDANNVQCAGLGLVEFSEQRKATAVSEFIFNKQA
jgi:hypothetical protein